VASGRLADGQLLAERAVTHIRRLIASGELSPGDRVKEVEISNALGISRGPVREAVRRLCGTGLLVAIPNHGSSVVLLTEATVRDAYEVRERLESLAASLAAQNMTDTERMQLLSMLDEHEEVMRQTSATSYPSGDSDWDFHLRILLASRNSYLWRICGEELRDIMTLMRAQHASSEPRGLRALQEHRWIAESIRDGNADLAGALMTSHIRAARDNLLGKLAVGNRKVRQLHQDNAG